MSHGLTRLGVVWTLTSLLSALTSCTSYFLPYWLVGKSLNSTIYLGVFRRCNYLAKGLDGTEYIKHECGRYTTFADIPSDEWRICTVLIGLACAFLLLVAFTLLLASCVKDVVTKFSTRIGGVIQFLSGFLLAMSCVLYPWGWDSIQVRQVCGPAVAPFATGHCTMSWGFYLAMAGTALAFTSAALSLQATKRDPASRGANNIQSTSSLYMM